MHSALGRMFSKVRTLRLPLRSPLSYSSLPYVSSIPDNYDVNIVASNSDSVDIASNIKEFYCKFQLTIKPSLKLSLL